MSTSCMGAGPRNRGIVDILITFIIYDKSMDDMQVKYIIKSKLRRFFNNPEPSLKEKKLIDDLRLEIQQISERNFEDTSLIDPAWIQFRSNLRKELLTTDPRFFLESATLRFTMFHVAKIEEFNYLQSLDNWPILKKALKESNIGNPERYFAFPDSSGNLIHHAYSLFKFLNMNNLTLKNINTIFEFGGGYGSFCRLCYELGFSGKYIIYDLPEFTALQKYFLKSVNPNININSDNDNKIKEVKLISDIHELKKVLKNEAKIDIFVGLWSISECPLLLRYQLLNSDISCSNYLFAFAANFGGVNNQEYFSEFTENNKKYSWKIFPIKHLQKNFYLFGYSI